MNDLAFTSGEVGQAFRLDGTNYAQVADDPALRPANLTIEGWFQFAATNDMVHMVAKPLGADVLDSFVLLWHAGHDSGRQWPT